MQKSGMHLQQIGPCKTAPDWNFLWKSSLLCDIPDFWISIIPFSEKKSKVLVKTSSFGRKIYVTTIDNVLEKQYISFVI